MNKKLILFTCLVFLTIWYTPIITQAQWYNPADLNLTTGFVYITNTTPFIDRMDYNYNPIYRFNRSYETIESGAIEEIRQGMDGALNNFDFYHALNYSTIYNSTGFYEFDGVTSYMNTTFNPTTMIGNNVFTITTWFKVPNNDDREAILSFHDLGTYNNFVEVRIGKAADGNDFEIDVRDGAAGAAQASTGVDVRDNNWHFGALTRINSTNFILYIDDNAGVETQNNNEFTVTVGNTLVIGNLNGADDFNGSIGEIRIWNTSLSAAQIQQERNSSNPVNPDNLVLSYSFDSWAKNTTHAFDTSNIIRGRQETNQSQAFRFDGLNDEITTTFDPDSVIGQSDFSVAVWFKVNSTNDRETMLSFHDLGTYNNFVEVRIGKATDGNDFEIDVRDGAAGAAQASTGVDVRDNNWHFGALTRINSTNFILYIDDNAGVETQNNNEFKVTVGNTLVIGNLNGADDFNGSIGEIRIWNTSLSAAQIQQERNSSNPVNPDNLVLSYSFDSWAKNTTHAFDTSNIIRGRQETNQSQAFRFDGLNDEITTTFDPDSVIGQSDFSVAVWFKVNSTNDRETMLSFHDAGLYKDFVEIRVGNIADGNDFEADIRGGAAGSARASSNIVVNDNDWHLGVLTRKDYTITMYVDNNTGVATSNTNEFNVTVGDTCVIGNLNGADDFNGSISEIMIFNRTLTSDEVLALYNGVDIINNIYRNNLSIDHNYEVLTGRVNQSVSDNGFGFDTNTLSVITTSNNYDGINFTKFNDYDSWEFIIKAKNSLDLTGTSYSQITTVYSLGYPTQTNGVYWRGGGASIKTKTDAGITIDSGITPDLNAWVWFKFRYNSSNDWYEIYYADDIDNVVDDWVLLSNYTITTNYPSGIYLTSRNSETIFDNFMIREIIPHVNPEGTYYLSQLYDNSNETTWNYSVITPYLYNVNQSSMVQTNTDPNDDFVYNFTLTKGKWYINSKVCDIELDCANNDSQNVYIGMGYFNLTFYNEITEVLINDTTITVEITSSGFSNNYTTSTGNLLINIPDGSYDIRFSASGYNTREYYSSVTAGLVTSLDLYLLTSNSSISDLVILTVVDENSDIVENITIKLQRNYLTNGTTSLFKTVSMTRTNYEGQAGLYVELYDVWYKLIFEQNGVVVDTSDVTPFLTTTPTITINLGGSQLGSFRNIDNIYYNLSFVNSSGTIYARFFYSDTDNIMRIGCLDVKRISVDGLYNVCYNCSTSTSATLSCIIDPNAKGEYQAIGYIDTNSSGSWYPVEILNYKLDNPLRLGLEGVFLTIIIAVSMMFMGIASVTSMILFLILGLIGMSIGLFLSGFTLGWIYYIITIGIIIIFLVRGGKN